MAKMKMSTEVLAAASALVENLEYHPGQNGMSWRRRFDNKVIWILERSLAHYQCWIWARSFLLAMARSGDSVPGRVLRIGGPLMG
jgi:hypothetical protein